MQHRTTPTGHRTTPTWDVVLSLHPRHATAILDGGKTIELRRRFTRHCRIPSQLLLYAASPVQALVGAATLDGVDVLPISEIIGLAPAAALTPEEVSRYLHGLKTGWAMRISDAWPIRKIPLAELRQHFGWHNAPRSWGNVPHDPRYFLPFES